MESYSFMDVFIVDWSFVLILVLLAVMTAAVLVRRARAKRRARRDERRAAHRAYRRWLRNSGMQPMMLPPARLRPPRQALKPDLLPLPRRGAARVATDVTRLTHC